MATEHAWVTIDGATLQPSATVLSALRSSLGVYQTNISMELSAEPAGLSAATMARLNAAFEPSTSNSSYVYNTDGTIAQSVENGVTTTFTYASGEVITETRNGVTRTYSYDLYGNLTGEI